MLFSFKRYKEPRTIARSFLYLRYRLMIIKASQRGGARNLANHLTNQIDNDHIELSSITGLAGNSVHAALLEIEAVSKGTRATQPLFSVSFNPPIGELVTNDQFEQAFDKLALKLGLQDQPRLAIFHEKEGRRHAHVVWSRIDIDGMTAINLSHFKRKCTDISRELYLEHGWQLPEGLRDHAKRDPFNLTNGEWQQAKRQGIDPRQVKSLIQEAWEHSDNLSSFNHALEERGLFLARGDKRGFVALDHTEKIYSVSRHGGIRTKELKSRLGSPEALPSVEQVELRVRRSYDGAARELIDKLKAKHKEEQNPLREKKILLIHIQRAERQELKDRQRVKRHIVTKSARDKFRRGIRGLFDKVTGKEKRLHRINRKIVSRTKRQQLQNRSMIVFRHNMERLVLQKDIIALRTRQHEERKALAKRIHHMRSSERVQDRKQDRRQVREGLSREFEHVASPHEKDRSAERSRKRSQKRTQGADSPSRTRHRKFD
jgi:hypothetical protein